MIYTTLIQSYAWAALAARRILSTRQFGAAALAVALALSAALLSGSTAVYAQEAATEPVAASVNINAADAQAMAAGLTGVGESRAMEIVRYREAYGPFSSVEELAEVKGIGKSTLEKNRSVITLE